MRDSRLTASLSVRLLFLSCIALALGPGPARAEIEAIPVPWDLTNPDQEPGAIPHAAYNGHPTWFKAIARGLPDPNDVAHCWYRWDLDEDGDFSDETPQQPRSCVAGTPGGTTCYDLGISYYSTQKGVRTLNPELKLECPGEPPVYATYSVRYEGDYPEQTDPNSNATSHPELATPEQLAFMRDAAIDDALWFLHLRMINHGGSGAAITGEFTGGPPLETAAAFIWLASLGGHLPAYPPGTYDHAVNPGPWYRPPAPPPEALADNDLRWEKDPYAETMARAINFALSELGPLGVFLEAEADDGNPPIPDTNDGIGLQAILASTSNYPDAVTAPVVGFLTGLPIAQVGDPNHVLGWPLNAIGQQMVDAIIDAQIDGAVPDMGGWPEDPNVPLHDARASVRAYAALRVTPRGEGGIYVNDLCRERMASVLKHDQDPNVFLSQPQIGVCDGEGTFAATGGALVASGLLGWGDLDPVDPNVIALDYLGAPITAGEARAIHDAYVAGLTSRWRDHQVDCTGLTSGLFDNDGGTNPDPWLRTDGRGNAEAMLSVAMGVKSQPDPNSLAAFGPYDWFREIAVYAVHNQSLDGSWTETPWGGYLPGPGELGVSLTTAYMTLALTPALLSPSPCIGMDMDGDRWCTQSPIPDCDDGHPGIYPGAPDLCDGLNNDCLHPSWPGLAGTNEWDDDADGLSECAGDCDDGDPDAWGLPGAVQNLSIDHDPVTDTTSIDWEEPLSPGGAVTLYDVIRSPVPLDYIGPATCAESDEADWHCTDPTIPVTGEAFFYLVRPENGCGHGSVGEWWDGTPREAADCVPGPVALLDAVPNPAACTQTVSFDATGSFHLDPNRSLIRYDWDFGDGATAKDGGATQAHAYGEYGAWPATVTVTDDGIPPRMDSEMVLIDVSLGNSPPVPDADGPYVMEVDSPVPITLDGSGSYDPNPPCDDIVRFEWDLDLDGSYDIDANTALLDLPWSRIVALTPPLQWPADPNTGLPANTIALRVTDSLGVQDTATTTLTIYGGQPVAVADSSPKPAVCGEPVDLDGTSSYHQNPTRGLVAWEWDLEDDGTWDLSGSLVPHVFTLPGPHPVTLRVTDDHGPAHTDLDTIVVDVQFLNHPPVPAPGGPYEILEGDPLLLDASASSDPDEGCGDSIATYYWDLNGDGLYDVWGVAPVVELGWPYLASLVPPLLYPADPVSGLPMNTITLLVEDQYGGSGAAATTLTIYAPPPP